MCRRAWPEWLPTRKAPRQGPPASKSTNSSNILIRLGQQLPKRKRALYLDSTTVQQQFLKTALFLNQSENKFGVLHHKNYCGSLSVYLLTYPNQCWNIKTLNCFIIFSVHFLNYSDKCPLQHILKFLIHISSLSIFRKEADRLLVKHDYE